MCPDRPRGFLPGEGRFHPRGEEGLPRLRRAGRVPRVRAAERRALRDLGRPVGAGTPQAEEKGRLTVRNPSPQLHTNFDAESRASFAPGGRLLRAGDRSAAPSWPTRSSASAPKAPRRSTAATWGRGRRRGRRAAADSYARGPRGLRGDRRARRCAPRYRGRQVLTNPPPSAGGTLLALAMAPPGRATDGPPSAPEIVAVMEEVQAQRTPEFVEGLRRARLRRPLPRLAPGLDDAHLGRRRRRPRVQRDLHQRRGGGRHRPRHRRPRQQHHGRAGPQPARLLPATRRAAGCRR